MAIQSDYLGRVFDPVQFRRMVKLAKATAHQVMKVNPFDSIAFTGVSGSAMAFILGEELGVKLLCVRKSTDNSHYVSSTGSLLEGELDSKKYLFVDDFICSGETFRKVRCLLKEQLPDTVCVGALTYSSDRQDWLDVDGYRIYSCAPHAPNQLGLDFTT